MSSRVAPAVVLLLHLLALERGKKLKAKRINPSLGEKLDERRLTQIQKVFKLPLAQLILGAFQADQSLYRDFLGYIYSFYAGIFSRREGNLGEISKK